jgi:hypothetical protein
MARSRTIYQFNKIDGRYPAAAIIQGPDGYFYGTTPLAARAVRDGVQGQLGGDVYHAV